MKLLKIRLAVLLATILIFSSCDVHIEGRGMYVTEYVEISSRVDGIGVHGNMDLILDPSLAPGEVYVSAYENVLGYLVAEGDYYDVDWYLDGYNIDDDNIEIRVSKDQFAHFRASGASQIIVEGKQPLYTVESSIVLSGNSAFYGAIDASDAISLKLSGASYVELYGQTHYLQATLSGDSFADAYQLECVDAEVNMSGASELAVYVIRDIFGRASGMSYITVGGRPRDYVQLSGNAAIQYN